MSEDSKRVPKLYEKASYTDFAIADFEEHDSCRRGYLEGSMLILGANGVGKTHLAAGIFNNTAGSRRWTSASRLVIRARSTFNNPAESELQLLEEFEHPSLVVIDDLSAVNSSEYARATLLAILDTRINNCLQTIVTTYQNLEQIAEWDPSIADRLRGFTPVVLKGPSRRRPGGEDERRDRDH